MFTWISDIAYFFARFIPHIRIIRSTHAGVRFKYGKPHHIEGGRLIVYWPIVTELLILPKVRQTTEYAVQFLTTFDGVAIAVCMVNVYRIKDVFTAGTYTFDVYSVVDDIAQTTLAGLISNTPFQDVQEDVHSFNEILTREVQGDLAAYGIEVESVRLISFAKCIVLRNIGDTLSWNPGRQFDEATGEKT